MSGRVSELLRRNQFRESRPERVPLSEAEKARQERLKFLRERDENDVPEWDEDEHDDIG